MKFTGHFEKNVKFGKQIFQNFVKYFQETSEHSSVTLGKILRIKKKFQKISKLKKDIKEKILEIFTSNKLLRNNGEI